MDIKDFAVEQWMNAWETQCRFNVAETCCDSLSIDELFELGGASASEFLGDLAGRRLTYGHIEGSPEFLSGVCSLYRTVAPEHVVPTHGAAGANMLVLSTLCGPGDHVVAVMPTYQQLYSIPEMCGAEVSALHLDPADRYHVDVDRLMALCRPDTSVICINNPNNPTGALLSTEELKSIVEVARSVGAWLVCDEVYRPLNAAGGYQESVADLYERAVCTSSMSKAWSLAGIRLGWVVCKDDDLRRRLLSHRDYDLISCSMLDEAVGAFALAHKDALIERSRRIVRDNRAVLMDWVAGEEHLSVVEPEGGTTALVYYDYPMDSYEFCTRLVQEEGALVTPGDCFEEPRSMRIGYAYSADPSGLREGLEAVSRFCRTVECELEAGVRA
ncbi:aminotransferase class I/II-fold pyridoxal phosphate-dependent enzyme [Atopobiaceae bacterium 24-176]